MNRSEEGSGVKYLSIEYLMNGLIVEWRYFKYWPGMFPESFTQQYVGRTNDCEKSPETILPHLKVHVYKPSEMKIPFQGHTIWVSTFGYRGHWPQERLGTRD